MNINTAMRRLEISNHKDYVIQFHGEHERQYVKRSEARLVVRRKSFKINLEACL